MDEIQAQMQYLAQLKTLLLAQAYDPAMQLAGFLLTGDPGYLPPGLARRLAVHMQRDLLLEELTRAYLQQEVLDADHAAITGVHRHNPPAKTNSRDIGAVAGV